MSESSNRELFLSLERLSTFNTVPPERKYWLIRTQAGIYYESFVDNGYIGIGYNEVPYSQLSLLGVQDDRILFTLFNSLKDFCEMIYPEDTRPGLIASQLIKFAYNIKRGDIVVIPSENSETITIGYVEDTTVHLASELETIETHCPFIKRKKVYWEKEIPREKLDPYLYRVLQAHQAINDISSYSELIERNLNNFFIADGIGNLVLNVRRSSGLNASDVFKLGYSLLSYTNEFIQTNNVPFNISALEVKISLNSEGKIHFKSSVPAIALIIGLLLVGLAGGGFKYKGKNSEFSLETNGIINSIIDFQNNAHDRQITDTLIYTVDSLNIQSPDDALKVFRQFATNKPK